MGFLNSAWSWLQDNFGTSHHANMEPFDFSAPPPANMSLNSNSNNFGTPIKIDPSGSIKIYNPLINRASDAVTDVLTKGVSVSHDDLTKAKLTTPTGGHSASEVYSAPVTPEELDYLNAELASHYGMSKETAYQEALSNTAYQRSVKDMQAAGLNPAVIYGSGKGSPAGGVYSVGSTSSGTGVSGGSIRRSGGSSKNNDKLFTSGEFYGISAAAGLVSAIVTKNPNAYWIGQTVAQGAMTAADSLLRK